MHSLATPVTPQILLGVKVCMHEDAIGAAQVRRGGSVGEIAGSSIS